MLMIVCGMKVTSAKVTVRRAVSVTMGSGTTTLAETQLSRRTSDVSTPVSVTVSRLNRRRRVRHGDNESSSCSSTEAVNQLQSDDAWNDNPVYADERRQRPRKAHRTRHIATVDTDPLDDILVDTQRHQLTTSSVELSTSPSRRPTLVPLQTSTATFKSEPDITAAVVIQDLANMSDLDACRGAMIDCISVAAPDDTVIKPSQLRASMQQRRTDDSRQLMTDKPVVSSDPAPLLHKVWRGAGSLREPKQTPCTIVRPNPNSQQTQATVDGETGFVRKKFVINDGTTSELRSSTNRLPTTKSPVDSYTFSVPHKKTVQSPELFDARSPTYRADSNEHSSANAVGSLSYDQLLYQFNEVYVS